MSRATSIRKFALAMKTAADGESWILLDQYRERLKVLLLEAAVYGGQTDVSQIEAAFSTARGGLVFGHGVDPATTATSAAAMLGADAETARLVARMRPTAAPMPQSNATEAILAAIRGCNAPRGISNVRISELTGHPEETVSRIVTALRQAGAVTSERVGAFNLTRISQRPTDTFSRYARNHALMQRPALPSMQAGTFSPTADVRYWPPAKVPVAGLDADRPATPSKLFNSSVAAVSERPEPRQGVHRHACLAAAG